MTSKELFANLKKHGVELSLDGENLRYRAPKGALTDRLLQAIKAHKGRLIELLQKQTTELYQSKYGESKAIIAFQEPKHTGTEADIKDTESSEIASTDIQEPTTPIPIDAKPRRLLFKDDYAEIFQEVLRCEYLCRQRNLRYDRVRYLGDYDLRKCKEFLLDYLSSLCDLLEYSIQERSAIQEFG